MTHDRDSSGSASHRPLAGATGWLITDGKTGMDVQVRGVAEALGLAYDWKYVDPKGVQRWLSPWAGVARREKFGTEESSFAPPWPQVALATGRASIPYLRALKTRAGARTFTVVLQDPKTGPRTADLIWVPEHDQRRGVNVITTPTAPHSFSAARLSQLADETPSDIRALPGPRVAVILGGKNAVYKFTDADDDRLARALASLGRLGASFMITPSRRTHERLIRVTDAATRDFPRVLWTGEGANPYPHFLANADLLVVTADSVNMTGECCATGKPVYVFEPSQGSDKFRRFHNALQAYGATRPLPIELTELPTWDYRPLDSAAMIAAEIERRWLRRSDMLSGLMDEGRGDRHGAAHLKTRSR